MALVHPSDEAGERAQTTSGVPNPARLWVLPAIVRPQQMSFHAGQVALPGGMIEPGESPVEAGLRELEEELGRGAGQVEVLGQLTPVYVFVSNVIVTPVVAYAPRRPRWEPNPAEVAEVVEIHLDTLLTPSSRGSHTIERRGLKMRAPHFDVSGRWIWGATAMILAEFTAVLSAARMQIHATG
jgi:8-oxo-dGTP pyrophosphatase MutT (NUDIX family)